MLDYFALGVLFFSFIVVFYGVIIIHDIPFEIAEKRNHPHQDAIHVAGWISLFTLHAIWPFLWIWATLYRADRGWGFSQNTETGTGELSRESSEQIANILQRLDNLESRLVADKPGTGEETE